MARQGTAKRSPQKRTPPQRSADIPVRKTCGAEFGQRTVPGMSPPLPITNKMLPEDWQVVSIRDAYRFTAKPRGVKLEESGTIPFLRMEQIPIGRVHARAYTEKPVAELTSGTYVENGDLLVAKITPSFENGKQAILRWDRPYGFATTEVIPIQAIDGISDPEFLAHFLLHPEVRSDLAGKMDGTTGRQRLSKETLASRLLPLPPLLEQKKIAHILSTVQRAIAEQERVIQATTELKKALMQKLFTEGLRSERQKQTEIGLVPESWEVVELGNHCRVQSGFAFRSQDYVKSDGGIPITKIGDIQDGGVCYTEKSSYVPDEFWADRRLEQFKLQFGDVLIALTGATTGKSGVFQHQQRAFLNQRAGRFLPDDRGLKRRFLPFLVRQPYFQNEISSNILVAAQGNISPKRIEKIKIGLPASDVQEGVASSLEALDRKVTCSQTKRNALQDLFRILLHELMSAKTRVAQIDIISQ